MDSERIVLGSGKVYCMEFEGKIPEDEIIETEDNRLGHIQGGATLEYKPTPYTAKDDLGLVSKTVITEEEATFKSGILTFNTNTLNKLCATGRVTEKGNRRILKIGGTGNQSRKNHLLRFLHEDDEDGNIRVTIVGKNEAGFSMAFAKDKETVIDAEFKAQPLDGEGTLIIIDEEIVQGGISNGE